MKFHSFSKWAGHFLFPPGLFALTLLIPGLAVAQTQPVSVTVADNGGGAELAPRFLGLSYEALMLLPKDGHYYFNADDQALVNTFKTLGIKSLRVGANAVDDPRIPVPQEKDIDSLFNFARVAGVKVIYSFRLKNGDPANSARLASYITAHDSDVLECFSIGNEPNLYPAKTNEANPYRSAGTNESNLNRSARTNRSNLHQTYQDFYAQWKPEYDAILKAVPQAKFDGPSADGNFALRLAKDVFADGHMAMVSDHYYFLGSGRAAETDPPASRDRFLSNHTHGSYENAYAKTGGVLAGEGVPYRIDELNSCYNGGAKDSSDTYASTLWALDCTHWWAAHHILGMNYHTGESVGRDGKFGPPNYAAFLRQTNGPGFYMRPQAYAYLAFSQGAHGQPLEVKLQATNNFNFNAYAYRDKDGSIYLTLINKSYGDQAEPASVSLQLPPGTAAGTWQQMDLAQKDQDIAAKTGVILGGAAVDTQGIWAGQWKKVDGGPAGGNLAVQVPAASATILRFSSGK